MSVGRALGPIAALVASAALGGAVAIGAVALLGGLDGGDTTVVTETSAAGRASPGAGRRDRAEHPRDLRARGLRRGTRQRHDQLDVVRPARRPVRSESDDAAVVGARIRLRHRQGGPHRHELPRGRGCQRGHGQLLEPRHRQGRGRRRRPVHGPRSAARGRVRERTHPASARQLRQGRRRATRSSRSATPSGSTAPSPPGS